MKTILIFPLLLIPVLGICQTNFYQKDGEKISVVGEQTLLTFSKDISIDIPKIKGDAGAMVPGGLIASIIPSVIDLGFKISSNMVKNNLKKYANDFSTKNTYTTTEKYITNFKIQRKIIHDNNKEDAFVIEFIPLKINENSFVFAVDKIQTKYSGAKSKKGYNFNDYTIEIKVNYFDGKEKKEQMSSPISLQQVEISTGNSGYELKDKNTGHYIYLSDKFPLNPNFEISEVLVKIVETNTAKIRVEKIKSFYDEYSEDAKEYVKNIVNFYVEK